MLVEEMQERRAVLWPRVQEWLKTVRYKPGTRLSLDVGPFAHIGARPDQVNVDVAVTVDNLYDQDKKELISAKRLVRADTHEHFLEDLFQIFMDVEQHEAEEWFRDNGKPVHDPHPELGKRRYPELAARQPVPTQLLNEPLKPVHFLF